MIVEKHSTAQITAHAYEGDVRLFEQHAGPWLDLCCQAATDEPFFRPEWIAAYVRAFEPDGKFLLATVHSDNRLVALLPLAQKRTLFCGLPVRMLRGTANEHSCRFDLIRAASEIGDLAVRSIWDLLRDKVDWDLIELPFVPEGGSAEQLLRFARDDGFLAGYWESYRSPFIPLSCDDRADLIPPNPHFRQNLQRRIRKAKANWDVRLRCIDKPDPIGLSRFYRLESSGWKGKRQTAIASSRSTRQFYDEIATVASQFGYFSLYLLEFGDAVVAAHFGLRYRGKYYFPKGAYDENYAAYGPGHIIIGAILREILLQGFREFNFLGSWEGWKAEWARHGLTHSCCYIFRPGLYGHALYAAKLKFLKPLRPLIRRARRSVAGA